MISHSPKVMPRRRALPLPALLVTALVALPGCKSAAEKLVDLRAERISQEDALYQSYGGSVLANAVNTAAREGGAPANPLGDLIGNAAKDADRTAFLVDCLQVGTGERPTLLSDKARTYFATPEAKDGCKRLAKLNAEIASLEQAALPR